MILVITYRDGNVSRRSADCERSIIVGKEFSIVHIDLIKGDMAPEDIVYERVDLSLPMLTAKQEEVYQFIKDRISAGASPTVREISEHFGWSSPTASVCHIEALKKKGYITRDNNSVKARNIRLT